MNDRNYKNYKIALTHSKVTTASISPYLSHHNGTFFASSVFHEMLTERYTKNTKKLFMLLNQMIFDLFTRELFPIFSIWKNASALPMAAAPAK